MIFPYELGDEHVGISTRVPWFWPMNETSPEFPGKEGKVELEVFMSVPYECFIGGYFDI